MPPRKPPPSLAPDDRAHLDEYLGLLSWVLDAHSEAVRHATSHPTKAARPMFAEQLAALERQLLKHARAQRPTAPWSVFDDRVGEALRPLLRARPIPDFFGYGGAVELPHILLRNAEQAVHRLVVLEGKSREPEAPRTPSLPFLAWRKGKVPLADVAEPVRETILAAVQAVYIAFVMHYGLDGVRAGFAEARAMFETKVSERGIGDEQAQVIWDEIVRDAFADRLRVEMSPNAARQQGRKKAAGRRAAQIVGRILGASPRALRAAR